MAFSFTAPKAQVQLRWVNRLKPLLFLACLAPLAITISATLMGKVADPVKALTHVTGEWGLRLLIVTLMITPLRWISGWNAIIRWRRMLGVFSFAYILVHFLVWAVLDQSLSINAIAADIIKRQYIFVGFLSFIILAALAATSTDAMVRRMGGRNWQRLHNLVYVAALGGGLHFIWSSKLNHPEPFVYAFVIVLLLAWRGVHYYRGRRRNERALSRASTSAAM